MEGGAHGGGGGDVAVGSQQERAEAARICGVAEVGSRRVGGAGWLAGRMNAEIGQGVLTARGIPFR